MKNLVLLFALLFLSLAGLVPSAAASDAFVAVRWGYYVTYAADSLTSLQENAGHLTHVSPYYYQLQPDGSISGQDQAQVNALIRQSGGKVLPMIKNVARYDDFHEILSDPAMVTKVINGIIRLVESQGYDGIHVDFEAVNGSDRALLTDFMQRLWGQLHPRNKLVTMALAAKAYDRPDGWAGSYDYSALAPYLDLAVIMAYDYTSAGSARPGPVAPIGWVRDVGSFSVATLGRAKTVLGVPFYGYDWNVDAGPPGSSRGYRDTMDLKAQYGGQEFYSEQHQEPYLRYVKEDQQHEVWFENSRSFQAKLEVVRDLGLAGYGSWRLGHEDPEVWTVVSALKNPADPVGPDAAGPSGIYFPETGHTMSNPFTGFWDAYGGLMIFGYPKTEPYLENAYSTQYYERARFEHHPEFAGTDWEVELGLLGREITASRGQEPAFRRIPAFRNSETHRYFPDTGHSLAYGFKNYWENNGDLWLFGFPISEEFNEVSPTDGEAYTVQYFERARFEYHPEFAGTRFEVLLGLLGNQQLAARGWIR
jgi:spore germination protein